jgi:protein tyrosine phosphatase (PTP) superfamily phosphohydrolase (DUF442 family)
MMRKLFLFTSVCCFLAHGAVSAQTAPIDSTDPAAVLLNGRIASEGVLTGGAPQTPEGYRALAAAGYRTLIDLRSDAEITPEARAAIDASGLAYDHLAIAGEQDLDLTHARALDALLDDSTRYPIVLVCGSGNRVGALVATKSFWLDSLTAEDALERGRRAGLTKLEPSVRLLLGLPPLLPVAPVAPAQPVDPKLTPN